MTSKPHKALPHGLSKEVRAGDFVFASLGCGTAAASKAVWPAVVLEAPGGAGGGGSVPRLVSLHFFGDDKKGSVPMSRIFPFEENCDSELVQERRCAIPLFALAMEHANKRRAHSASAANTPSKPVKPTRELPAVSRVHPNGRRVGQTSSTSRAVTNGLPPPPQPSPPPALPMYKGSDVPSVALEDEAGGSPLAVKGASERAEESVAPTRKTSPTLMSTPAPATPALAKSASAETPSLAKADAHGLVAKSASLDAPMLSKSASWKAAESLSALRTASSHGLVGHAQGPPSPSSMVFAILGNPRASTLQLWPAVIVEYDADSEAPSPTNGLTVEFYGDRKQAIVPLSKLFPYAANRDADVVQRRRQSVPRFGEAMEEAELEYAADQVRSMAKLHEAAARTAQASRSGAALEARPRKRVRTWRLAHMTNFIDDDEDGDGDDYDNDTSEAAYARRHEPFELLERAGFSSSPMFLEHAPAVC
jgi:hypothetical protein